MNEVTVDMAIAKLEQIKRESSLGGDTCLALCLVGSGIEYVGVDEIVLEKDQDGATALVKVTIPHLQADPPEIADLLNVCKWIEVAEDEGELVHGPAVNRLLEAASAARAKARL